MAAAAFVAGQSTSNAVDFTIFGDGGGLDRTSKIIGIWIPAGFTAATLSFLVKDQTDGTFVSLRDSLGAVIGIVVPASGRGFYFLDIAPFLPNGSLKLQSSVAQAAASSVILEQKVL